MPDTPHYVIDPTSLQGCRIRLTFHYQELQCETHPDCPHQHRPNLAKTTADLAPLEVQSANAVPI